LESSTLKCLLTQFAGACGDFNRFYQAVQEVNRNRGCCFGKSFPPGRLFFRKMDEEGRISYKDKIEDLPKKFVDAYCESGAGQIIFYLK